MYYNIVTPSAPNSTRKVVIVVFQRWLNADRIAIGKTTPDALVVNIQ